jgi:ribonuclease E
MKQMIINASASEEMRVAILEADDRGERRLLDLDIENQARSKHKGNIYKGIVANVEDSLEAAFIEFGDDKQAFLALSEVRPALYPAELRGNRRPKISDVLKRGQEIIVQVTKDEIGNKGAAVTTYLSLPGRYVVLMHSDEAGGGVSRKVDDEQARRRAREILNHIDVPDGMAVIIRTAGVSRPRLDLYRDLKNLAHAWESIDRGAAMGRAPTLLYREPDLVVRTIRDYLAPDVTKVVIDSEDEYEELKSYFEATSPESVGLLELHSSKQPVFEKYGIETAIEELFERQVKLPSGGYLVIDQTEALVAIDVNSGRSTRESDHEATVYKTNLEAAREIGRHLRLRDMGGIVVVDFIDMVNRRHDRDVERAIREAMKDDKARVKISRISENGTMEITRQRLRQAHRLVSHTPCPHCSGTGIVRDPRGLAVRALRELSNKVAKGSTNMARLQVRLPVEVANILTNTKRRELLELGDEHQVLIDIIADARLEGSEIRYDEERRGKAGLDAASGFRDPRLNDRSSRNGRNGRRGRRDEGAHAGFGGPTLPPPSIGPVPTFLHDEAAIIEADARDAAEIEERERLAAERIANGEVDVVEVEPKEAGGRHSRHERHERGERPERDRGDRGDRGDRPERTAPVAAEVYPEHYDDALSEALFGKAPAALSLADVEAKAPEVAAVVATDGEASGKKRRRRRRRKKKGGVDGQGVATESNDNAEGGDDEDGDDEGDENASVIPVAASAEGEATDPVRSAEEDAAWAAYHNTGTVEAPAPAAVVSAPVEVAAVVEAEEPVAVAAEDVVAVEDEDVAAVVADVVESEPTKKKRPAKKAPSRAKKVAAIAAPVDEPEAEGGAEAE